MGKEHRLVNGMLLIYTNDLEKKFFFSSEILPLKCLSNLSPQHVLTLKIILGLASWLPLSGTCAAHWKHSVDSLVKNQFQGLQYPKTCRWLEKNGLHYIMIILTLYRFWKRCMLLSTLLLVINGWLLLQLPEFLSPFSIPHWCPFPDFMSPNVCITEVSI